MEFCNYYTGASEFSDEPAHPRSLARDFATSIHIAQKYMKLTSKS